METQLDLLEEIWYYYNTHTQEEIAELWKEIEQEKIDLLLKAAMNAPSVGNQQPWDTWG